MSVRWVAALGLTICSVLAGLAALIPALALLLASMTIWRPIAVADFFDDVTAPSVALLAVLLLLVALMPVVIGTLALRRRAGWHPAVAPAVTAAVVVAGLVTIWSTGAIHSPLS